MNDNFEFKLVGGEKAPFLGYISARDKTVISARALIKGSYNTFKTNRGTIAARNGIKRRGAADTTLAGVKASFTWVTSLGWTIPLRVCNNKLQIESDIVTSGTYLWYDLAMTSTVLSPAASLTRFVFDTWWDDTEKKDRLLMARGDTSLLHWSGGLAVIGTVDAAAGTIQLLDTTKTWAQMGFASNTSAEKRLIINGFEFSYTSGETTNTLTTVAATGAGNLADLTSGLVAVQAVIASTNTPASTFTLDFLKVLNNQVLCGSYTSRILYLSSEGDFTDYTNNGDLLYGDPDFIVLDSTPTGIAIRQGSFLVSAGIADWYIVTPNSTPPIALPFAPPSSKSSYVIINVVKKPGTGLVAAYGHEFIDSFGDDIIYLAKDQQVRQLGVFKNLTHPKFPSISKPVADDLKNEDFTGGHLRCIGEFIHVTAPNAGRDWMYQVRETVSAQGNVVAERLWHPPQIRNVSRFESIGGVTFGHSNTYPQLYEIWDTNQWYDDSPTDEQIPYSARARFGYWNGGRFRLVKFTLLFVEGYMYPGVPLSGNVFHNYQGASGITGFTVNSDGNPAKFYSGNVAPTIGSSSLGDNPLGDGLVEDPTDQELLPKFYKICKMTEVNEFEHAIEFYSDSVDSRWEILAFGPNLAKATEAPTFISKSG